MIAERLYQAIIDKASDTHMEWQEAAEACGFDPEVLLDCFGAKPDSRSLDIYDYLGREQIERTANFLGCPGIRIFFLADVYRMEDMRRLAAVATGDSNISRCDGLEVLGRYMLDLSRSRYFGHPEVVINELIAATLSASLEEACEKADLPFRKVVAWMHGFTGALSDLDDLRKVAAAIGIGMSPVLVAMGLLKAEDFFWNGQLVDPIAELNQALDVTIW